MKFLTDHQNMTADELNREMVTFLISACGHTFDENMPMTRENINWMTAVYAIDFQYAKTAEDLTNLLAALDKHYEGPINIHEGWGGCEADSNRDLIVSKIHFDLGECWEDHNTSATLSAIELGWVDADRYEESLLDASKNFTINANEGGGWEKDRLEIFYGQYFDRAPQITIYAFGKTEESRHFYRECASIEHENAEVMFGNLMRAISSLRGANAENEDICRYVRAWAKRNGQELQPYNTHLEPLEA